MKKNRLSWWTVAAATLLLFMVLPLQAQQSAGPAPRILSLSPHVTEIVYTLGAEDQLVAVTDHCIFPPQAQEKKTIGSYMNPNLELMLSLQPDLAFHIPGTRQLEGKLSAAGVDVVPIPGDTLDDIAKGIQLIGEKIGKKAVAKKEAEKFEEALNKRKEEIAPLEKKPRVLLVLGRDPGAIRSLFSVGPNTFPHEVIELSGGTNYMANSPAPYPTVMVEPLIADPPDVVIEHLALEQEEITEELLALKREQWVNALGPLAKKRTRFVFLSDKHLSIPGPGIIESIDRLRGIIHPKISE